MWGKVLNVAKKAATNIAKQKAVQKATSIDEEGNSFLSKIAGFGGVAIVGIILLPIILFVLVFFTILNANNLDVMFGAIGFLNTAEAKDNGYCGTDGYVQWAIDTANDDSHGYDMNNRVGNPDYDCSSFVYYSLINGGGFTAEELGGTWPFTTVNMGNILKNVDFEEYTFSPDADLQKGDIIMYDHGGGANGHTIIYIGDGKAVAAHSGNLDGQPGDSGANEITVYELESDPALNNYQYYYRLSSSSSKCSEGNKSVVECARGALGVPYVWGGTDYENGMDCSGLVYVCYQRALGVTVGRTTYAEYTDSQFEHVSSIDQLVAGDLVQPTDGHVMIYTGEGTLIHEPQSGDVCKEVSIDSYPQVKNAYAYLHYKGSS